MFNLIVAGVGWKPNGDTFPADRVLEHTDDVLEQQFKPNDVLDLEAVIRLPTLFVQETQGRADRIAYVGTIVRGRLAGEEYRLDYVYDQAIPPIPNSTLAKLSGKLQISDWEFSRTHWAIKDVDLFRVLLTDGATNRPAPRVFKLSDRLVDVNLVSVMMPFDARFLAVYAALDGAAQSVGMQCRRTDDIWIHDAVIKDVVELICTSSVVICDLSGKNANVFYEVGIAHALGKNVIMITQSAGDVPFDLRHLRYVEYLNNGEGHAKLAAQVRERLETLHLER